MLKIGMIGAGIAKEVHLPAISMSNYFEVTSYESKNKNTNFSYRGSLEKKD